IDAIIHFAAFKAVGESVESPLRYYRNNLLSLMNTLEEGISRGIDKFVFSSSCTVYGDTDNSPVNENESVGSPSSPYGQTKLIGENILKDAVNAYGFHCVSLRYFNPAGAHQSALIGENPLDAPNNLVPVITQVASGRRSELTVFGNDYPTPDGTCIRDYIHVSDLARAHVSAIDYMINVSDKQNFEVFNLGSGTGNSVLEVISAFERVTGLKLNFKTGPRRPGDVTKIWADPSKANKLLGWKTELTLDDMMRSAWAWEMKQLH
ncbi:MAG: UDP-glucose 4-epimerase GalE, partial [Bacteroidota bacterium]